ncbi:MAG: CHAT domain-containing protein [Acidobacteria bacterium]|nr:CHAT domain-containing protein [Acidobacteriota bacterium]
MAVLSACETAQGDIGSGEGVVGLGWSFFIAGVPTIAAQPMEGSIGQHG